MIDQTNPEGKILTSALDLAASSDWDDLSLRDIADGAGIPLDQVMERFATKDDIVRHFIKLVDDKMLAGAADIEREQSVRDAVFEVVMSRFDTMAPYRLALKSISASVAARVPPDPAFLRSGLSTQNKILQAAGVSKSGASALFRQIGLAGLYAQVFRIWLNDDDPGMARTMAALDKRLRQGEQTLSTLDGMANAAENTCKQAARTVTDIFERLRPAPADAAAANGETTPDLTPTDGDASEPANPPRHPGDPQTA